MDINCKKRINAGNDPMNQPRCTQLKVITPIMCDLCEKVNKARGWEFMELMVAWHDMVDQQLEWEAK